MQAYDPYACIYIICRYEKNGNKINYPVCHNICHDAGACSHKSIC